MTAELWALTMAEFEMWAEQLSWKEDMCVWNDFGEHVWLKPLYVGGRRIGITDCCPADNPCERHKAMGERHEKGRA